MDNLHTALLPRGPQTTVLPVPRGTLVHPSFPNALPAIIAAPVEVGYCVHCAYLAQEIRAADARGDEARRLDYGLLGLRHWHAIHEKTRAVRGRPGGVSTTIPRGGAS